MNAIYQVTLDYNDVKVLKQIGTFGKKTTAKTNISKLNVITFIVYEEYFDVFATDSYVFSLVRFATQRERKTIMYVEDPERIAVREEQPITPLVFSVDLYRFNELVNSYLKTYTKATADKNTVIKFHGNLLIEEVKNFTHVDDMTMAVNNSYSESVKGYERNKDMLYSIYKEFLSDSKNAHLPGNNNSIRHKLYNHNYIANAMKLFNLNKDSDVVDLSGYDGKYGHALYMDKVSWSEDNVTWKKIWLMPMNENHYRSEDKSKYSEYKIEGDN